MSPLRTVVVGLSVLALLGFMVWAICAARAQDPAERPPARDADINPWLPLDLDPRDDGPGMDVPPWMKPPTAPPVPPEAFTEPPPEHLIPPSVVDHMIERVEKYLKEQVS